MKIILAGTPFFSVPTFETVIQNFDVVAIISQPNKKVGRNFLVSQTPVKLLAEKYKIPVFQPENIKDLYDELKKIDFDVLLTMAYGQIIPENILHLAKKASLNVHASLLPKYRGAAPIQHAILNGEKETGISLMYMEKTMDSGDVLFQEEIEIEENECFDSLLNKLSILSSCNIVNWLNKIDNNNIKPIKQDIKKVTFAPKILSEDERLNFDTMENTLRKINALNSIPGAYFLDPNRMNKRVKVFQATKQYVKNSVEIKCVDGSIYGIVYQIEGKKKISLI